MADETDGERLLSLEGQVRFHDGEIASLRATRHEHGNWLNRHNLELATLGLTFTQPVDTRFTKVESEVAIVKAAQAELQSKVQLLAWKIGAIIGLILFIANQFASRVHF